MHKVVVGIGFAISLISPIGLRAQSGGFVVRLGTDTLAVERYTRSADKIEGTLVRRNPQTTVVKYTIGLNRDGSVASYEQAVFRADGSPMPNVPAGTKMTFAAESITRTTFRGDQPVTLRSANPRVTLPAIGGSWVAYEMQIQAAKKGGDVYTLGFNAQQAAPTKADIRLIGSDSAEVVNVGFRTGFKLDRNGRIARGDGSLTTQKFITTPIATIDVNAIATAWSAKDAAGQAMGIASPRDTVTASVAGANITIDYGRPAKRGREIWGKLVPYDTTWRLGANAATQFRTDKDLEIGGVTVPAGFYTLWLYPTATKSWLVVNKQTGQWGTAYDQAQDLVRIPLQPHMNLPTEEERFRMFVQGDMLMMHWDKGGYGVKIASK
jgi:hypothetical protein